ncbi:MAG: hypothetical protein IJQ27_03710 [Spirochaetia bacterium]|nr:hypothetical protein [Spirochaetia bacterium]
MVEKTLTIDGKEVTFRASAAIPRLYRIWFKRDIFRDLNNLMKASQSKKDFEVEDLEVFENVAYCMAKHANPNLPPIEEWLDDFQMFSIYEILGEILELWGSNMFSMEKSKKK